MVNPSFKQARPMKWINVIMTVAVIVVNALANILPINGMNTGEISALYPNLFVPAGITFSIWSIIYLGLIGFVLYPFLSIKRLEKKISLLFIGTCILNIAWIFAWHYLQIEISMLIMLAFLIVLIKMYSSITIESKLKFWLVYVPMTIYFAWICVATIANMTALLVHWQLDIPYPKFIAVLMIGATQALVWFINYRKSCWPYSIVIIWALIGILIKRTSAETAHNEIIIAVIVSILFTLTITVIKSKNQSMISNPV